MLHLFQGPSCGIESAPGVTTRREPGPPVPNVLQAAGGKQSAFEGMAIQGSLLLTNDPIRPGQNSRSRPAQPFFIPREPIMLRQTPEDPTVVLIVAARFISTRTIQNSN